jgi:hypothetical protein
MTYLHLIHSFPYDRGHKCHKWAKCFYDIVENNHFLDERIFMMFFGNQPHHSYFTHHMHVNKRILEDHK